MSTSLRSVIILFAVIFPLKYAAAQNTGIGVSAGGGYISGESPNIASFTTSIFFDADYFSEAFYPRISFIYAGAFSKIVPDTRKKYFPFMKGLSVKGMMQQDYKDNFFLEEGLGVAFLNDRTFSTTNTWDPGIIFSLTGGIKLPVKSIKGFRIGVGAEYAFIFGGTFLRYFSLHAQAKVFL